MLLDTQVSLTKSVEFLTSTDVLLALRDAFTADWSALNRGTLKPDIFWEFPALSREQSHKRRGEPLPKPEEEEDDDRLVGLAANPPSLRQMSCLASLFGTLKHAAEAGDPERAWSSEWSYRDSRKLVYDIRDSLRSSALLRDRVTVLWDEDAPTEKRRLRLYVSFTEGELAVLVPQRGRRRSAPLSLRLARIARAATTRVRRIGADALVTGAATEPSRVLVLAGNYGCGKSTWAYDYFGRFREHTVLYAFDSTIPALSDPGHFLQSLEAGLNAVRGKRRARTSAPGEERVDTVLAMVQRIHLTTTASRVVLLLDNINDAGDARSAVLNLMRGVLAMPTPGVTLVATLRTPSSTVSQLKALGVGLEEGAFEDTEELYAIADSCRRRTLGQPVSDDMLTRILHAAASKIPLATRLIQDVSLRAEGVSEEDALRPSLQQAGQHAISRAIAEAGGGEDASIGCLLRCLAVLDSDYPVAALPLLLDLSHSDLAKTAERVAFVVRSDAGGRLALSPRSAASVIVGTAFSGDEDLRLSLRSAAERFAAAEGVEHAVLAYGYENLVSLLKTLNEPETTCQLLSDFWAARKSAHLFFDLLDVAGELCYRAQCEEALGLYSRVPATLIAAQTLVHNQLRRATSGKTILNAWGAQPGQFDLDFPDLMAVPKTLRILTLFSLLEHCALQGDMSPLRRSVKGITLYLDLYALGAQTLFGRLLDQDWFTPFCAAVLRRVSEVDDDLALELHQALLTAGKATGTLGTIIAYARALLLATPNGSEVVFVRRAVQEALDASAGMDGEGKGSTALEQLRSLLDDLDEGKHSGESPRNPARRLGDLQMVLRDMTPAARAAFAPDVTSLLEELVGSSGDDEDIVKGFWTARQALGNWPTQLAPQLGPHLERLVGLLEPPNAFAELKMKLCLQVMPAALDAELVPPSLARKLLTFFLGYDTEEVLVRWVLMHDFRYCAAALGLAEAIDADTVGWLWSSILDGVLGKPQDDSLNLLNSLITEAGQTPSQVLCSLAVDSIRSLSLPERDRDRLRASFPEKPVDEEDRVHCARIAAEIVPERNEFESLAPEPNAFACFLAMAAENEVISTEQLVSRVPRLLQDLGASRSETVQFLGRLATHIPAMHRRRAVLDAVRPKMSPTDFTKFLFRVEEVAPGTVPFGDLPVRDPFDLAYADLATYARWLAANDTRRLIELCSSLPERGNAVTCALLIHECVQATGDWALSGPEEPAYEELPITKAIEELADFLPVLTEPEVETLEMHAPPGVRGIRVVATGLAKCPTPLSVDIVARHIDRVCTALAAGRAQATGGSPELDASDTKAAGNVIVACVDRDARLQFAHRVLQHLTGEGRYTIAAFLDAVLPALCDQALPRHLQDQLSSVPRSADDQYRTAFLVRALRCLRGTPSAHRVLWAEALSWWIPDEPMPIEKQVDRFAGVTRMFVPEELSDVRREELDAHLGRLLRELPGDLGALTNTLCTLLGHSQTVSWLLRQQETLAAVLQRLFADLGQVARQRREALAEALARSLSDPAMASLLVGVCDGNDSSWEDVLVDLGGITDASGDLVTGSTALMNGVAAVCFPGRQALDGWFGCLGDMGVDDLSMLCRELAVAIASSPFADDWLEVWRMFLEPKAAAFADEECEVEDFRPLLVEFIMLPVRLIDAARAPDAEESDISFMDMPAVELHWKILRELPPTPSRQQDVVDTLQMLITDAPDLQGTSDSRRQGIDLAAKVFLGHPWENDIAIHAAEAASKLSSLHERLDALLTVGRRFKNTAVLAKCLDQFESEVLLRALPEADATDAELIPWIAAAFQVVELRSAVEDASRELAEDEIETSTPREFARLLAQQTVVNDRGTSGSVHHEIPSNVVAEEDKLAARTPEFLKDGDSWLNQLSKIAASLSESLTAQDLPQAYWWKLARCGRLAREPAFFRVLFRLCRAVPDYRLSADVRSEVFAALRKASGNTDFVEFLGACLPLLSLQDPGELTPVALLAQMADHARSARHALGVI